MPLRSVAVTLIVVALGIGFFLYRDAKHPSPTEGTVDTVMTWDTYRMQTKVSVKGWVQDSTHPTGFVCRVVGADRGDFIYRVMIEHEFPSTTFADLERFYGWLNRQLARRRCRLQTVGPL